MQSDISSISLNSKKGSAVKSKIQQGTCTTNDSKMLQLDSIPSLNSNDLAKSSQNLPLRNIQKNITNVEQAQKQLIQRFQKVKQNLIRQIEKKDEMNCLLQQEVKELREELEQSRKDLGIITDYIRKKALTNSDKLGTRKTLLGSTKNSDKVDKSKGGSKESISITLSSAEKNKIKKKSSSPRALFKKF